MISRGALVALVTLSFAAHTARADGRLLAEDTFAVRSKGTLAFDGGLLAAMPAALPSGISTGIAAGVTRECGCMLSYGARVSWSHVAESSDAWTVSDSDVRLRVNGAIRHAFGRGTLALRLGVGTNVVYEDRTRNQGMRAGLTGSALETRAIAALPASDLEGVVTLHIAGPWLVVASGGPTIDYEGGLHGGWLAQIGVGWQP